MNRHQTWTKESGPVNAAQGGKLLSTAFFVLSLVAAVLPSTVLAPLARRHGTIRVHTVCIASMAGAYLLAYLAAYSTASVYGVMALAGVGWAAIVSLPFAIMSQRVDESQIGLYMGIFNLSVVLPQLVASLGIGMLLAALPDKGAVFLIAAGSLAMSALAWLYVRRDDEVSPADSTHAAGTSHA